MAGNIFEAIPKKERDLMYDYIYSYGSKRNNIQPIEKLEYIMRFWEEAKGHYLWNMFGEKLILSKDIVFEKSSQEIEDSIRNTVIYGYDNECRKFVRAWEDLAVRLGDEMSDTSIYWGMEALISSKTLASNRFYDKTGVEIPLPGDKKYRVLPNTKASKAIGKIATAYNLPNYEEFRIAHSQCLNEKTVKGELCLSIHPLDYMTMSDNDCGWSSCMSWREHGDFRQGTVEMMNSPMVVVAYLKSSTDYCINDIDKTFWNSKRWRQLFIVRPGEILAIKGYPYWNEELEKTVLFWLKELAEKANIGDYEDVIKIYSAHNERIEVNNDECIAPVKFTTYLMYNDIYEEHAIILSKDYGKIDDYINYSGESECLSCGERLIDWDTESDLFCGRCDPVYRCSECGDYLNYDDMIEIDGALYCEYCANEIIETCNSCEDLHHPDNMYHILLAKNDDTILNDKEIILCEDCYFDGKYFDKEDVQWCRGTHWRSADYILVEDLTEEGLKIFGFDTMEEAMEYPETCLFEKVSL